MNYIRNIITVVEIRALLEPLVPRRITLYVI